MRFLVDNQLPPALARTISQEFGQDASHVIDLGLRDATDVEVWTYVSDAGAILISKDEDFVTMILHAPTARLVWVRVGNCRRAFLLDLFRQAWPRIMERLETGDRFIELR